MLIWWSYILVLGAWNEEKKVRWFLICSCPHLLICWGKNRKIFKKKWKDFLKKERWKDMERYSTCNDRSWWAAERSILHLKEKLSLELVLKERIIIVKFWSKNKRRWVWYVKIFVGEINKVAKQRVVSGKTAFVSRQQERKNRKSALFSKPQPKMFIFCFSFIFL